MVQPMFLNDNIFLLTLLIIYLIINGLLQIYFVLWVLGRNKKLTLLLVEHYRNLNMKGGDRDDYD
jgi:hypothetical protein